MLYSVIPKSGEALFDGAILTYVILILAVVIVVVFVAYARTIRTHYENKNLLRQLKSDNERSKSSKREKEMFDAGFKAGRQERENPTGIYSFGENGSLKFELPENVAASFNRARKALRDQEAKNLAEYGTKYHPDGIIQFEIHDDDAGVLKGFSHYYEKALKTHSGPIDKDESNGEYLVLNEVEEGLRDGEVIV